MKHSVDDGRCSPSVAHMPRKLHGVCKKMFTVPYQGVTTARFIPLQSSIFLSTRSPSSEKQYQPSVNEVATNSQENKEQSGQYQRLGASLLDRPNVCSQAQSGHSHGQ